MSHLFVFGLKRKLLISVSVIFRCVYLSIFWCICSLYSTGVPVRNVSTDAKLRMNRLIAFTSCEDALTQICQTAPLGCVKIASRKAPSLVKVVLLTLYLCVVNESHGFLSFISISKATAVT